MWSLKPGQALCMLDFPDGEESLVYNALSGDTHLLGAAAIDVLHLLQSAAAPIPTAALCDALGAALEQARDPGFDEELAALLAQLASLHLIDKHPC